MTIAGLDILQNEPKFCEENKKSKKENQEGYQKLNVEIINCVKMISLLCSYYLASRKRKPLN